MEQPCGFAHSLQRFHRQPMTMKRDARAMIGSMRHTLRRETGASAATGSRACRRRDGAELRETPDRAHRRRAPWPVASRSATRAGHGMCPTACISGGRTSISTASGPSSRWGVA